jgi:hypothetical protein
MPVATFVARGDSGSVPLGCIRVVPATSGCLVAVMYPPEVLTIGCLLFTQLSTLGVEGGSLTGRGAQTMTFRRQRDGRAV